MEILNSTPMETSRYHWRFYKFIEQEILKLGRFKKSKKVIHIPKTWKKKIKNTPKLKIISKIVYYNLQLPITFLALASSTSSSCYITVKVIDFKKQLCPEKNPRTKFSTLYIAHFRVYCNGTRKHREELSKSITTDRCQMNSFEENVLQEAGLFNHKITTIYNY